MSIALGGCLKAPPIEFGLTEDTGGHITYVLGAAVALGKRSDVGDVEIITRLVKDDALGEAYALPSEPVADKVRIRRLDTGDRRYLSKEAAIADRPAMQAALIAYIESLPRKPDIIHAHFADAATIALAVRDRFGIPFIYTAHSLAIEKASASAIPACPSLADRIAEENRIIGTADAIIASSRDESERQLMLYDSACPSRIHCVSPGAALSNGASTSIDRGVKLIRPFLRDVERPIILAIARPVQKKNLVGLVDLYANDPELRGRTNLVILAGLREGPLQGEPEQRRVIGDLLERLDRYDLYGQFALPKRHTQDDVASLYSLARSTGGIFANPAFTEPYGLTLTEAAQRGLPVVATCNGGARDIVAHMGHGVTADPMDPSSFAQAIRSLLFDKRSWRNASQAAIRNCAPLSWDAYADRFLVIAKSICRERDVRTPPHMKKQLLLCDIDNTITGSIAGAEELATYLGSNPGLAFGVATGRSLQEALRLLDEWRLPPPDVLITSVGSEIYWRGPTGGLVADRDYVAAIRHGWEPAKIIQRLEDILGLCCQPSVEQRRHKLSYFADGPSVVAAVSAAVRDLPVSVIHSHGRLLDILPGRAGKGAAMVWAARTLGIALSEVFAAGDSGNDLDMLVRCPNAILVANHTDNVAAKMGHSHVYIARQPHAAGVVEGLRAHRQRAAA